MPSNREQWRAIAGFEGAYEVSNRGRVRSLDRLNAAGRRIKGKVLAAAMNPARYGAYLYLDLQKHGQRHRLPVANLVLEAFDRPRQRDMRVVYIDGSKSNVRADNLRWRSVPHEAAARG